MPNGSVHKGSRLQGRPRRGRSDDKVRMLINMQQEGKIAFKLYNLAQLQLIGGSVVIESGTYEA